MFNNFNYNRAAPTVQVSARQVELLEKLIQLHDPDWIIDMSRTSKQLLELGVVTIKNGLREERYPFLHLVLHRLPQVLLSNNKYFLRGFIQGAATSDEPLDRLYVSVKNYYKSIKKKPLNF